MLMRTICSHLMLAALLTSPPTHGSQKGVLAALEARCEGGSAGACFEAGLAHEEGDAQGATRALAFHLKACQGGDLRGCNSAGVAHRRGLGTKRDAKRARVLTQRACEGKLAVGCFNLGAMLIEGEGGPPDVPRGKGLLTLACDAEFGPACSAIGAILLSGERAPAADALTQARVYLQRACLFKDGEGCYNLGQVNRALGQAEHLIYAAYEKACTLNIPAGCGWQGLLLHRGEAGALAMRGLRAKKARATGVGLMLSACEGGFFEGCFNAALAHIKGEGVAKDYQEAGRLLTRACGGGVQPACRLLERSKKKSKRGP